MPCTLVLEYCMMLCKMSLDSHLCYQGFFDAFLTVYLGRVKMDEKHSKFVNTAQVNKIAFDTSKNACNIMHTNDVYMHISSHF